MGTILVVDDYEPKCYAIWCVLERERPTVPFQPVSSRDGDFWYRRCRRPRVSQSPNGRLWVTGLRSNYRPPLRVRKRGSSSEEVPLASVSDGAWSHKGPTDSGGNPQLIEDPENVILNRVLAELKSLGDGLTWAKPNYQIKYLMDNCEGYRGLSDAAALFSAIGDSSNATYYNGRAAVMLQGIQGMWLSSTYAVYKNGTGGLVAPNWSTWYPTGSYLRMSAVVGDASRQGNEARRQNSQNAFPTNTHLNPPSLPARHRTGSKAIFVPDGHCSQEWRLSGACVTVVVESLRCCTRDFSKKRKFRNNPEIAKAKTVLLIKANCR